MSRKIKQITATEFINSNLANFGSDLETHVKKTSANSAAEWNNFKHALANKDRFHIWRIEKFHVVPWPRNLYGTWYNGDSYILCVVDYDARGSPIVFDIHFWIGINSTLDEAGVAAYKTVELDTFLNGVATQYRELQGHESQLFLSYMRYEVIEGGVESGFHHISSGLPVGSDSIESRDFQPKTYVIKGHSIRAFTLDAKMSEQACYILDLGQSAYVYEGSESTAMERIMIMYAIERIELHRCKKLKVIRDRIRYCDAVLNAKNAGISS